MSKMEVMKFKPFSKGALRGFFDLWIPKLGLELFGCSLHQKGNQFWINLPSREWKDETGETKYLPVIRLRNEDHFKAFKTLALECILAYCKENGIDPNGQQAPAPAAPAPFDSFGDAEPDGLPF